VHGLTQRVGGGGTGSHDTEVRAAGAEFDADESAADVADQRGNGERGNFARTFFEEVLQLVFVGLHATDTGTNDDADAVAVFLRHVDAAILDGMLGGDETELGVAVVATRLLRVHMFLRLPVAHFGTDLTGHGLGIEQGDPVDTALAGKDVFPERIDILAERGDGA